MTMTLFLCAAQGFDNGVFCKLGLHEMSLVSFGVKSFKTLVADCGLLLLCENIYNYLGLIFDILGFQRLNILVSHFEKHLGTLSFCFFQRKYDNRFIVLMAWLSPPGGG